MGVADGVECLHHARLRNETLHLFAEGVVEADVELRLAGGEVERIGGVDHDFAVEVVEATEADRVLRPRAMRREDEHVAELRRLFERAGRSLLARLFCPVAQLFRIARADLHVMSELDEPAGQHFADVA